MYRSTIIGLTALALACSVSAFRQKPASSDPLDRTIPAFQMNNATVENATDHLLTSNHLVGGIAIDTICDAQGGSRRSTKSFHFSNISVRQALDEIVTKDAGYRWQEDDGSIVVLPLSGMPELLTTRVKHLRIDDLRYTISAASGEILQLPEIKQRMAQLGLREGLQYLIGGVDKRDLLKTKISLSDVNMYEALNAIAQANSVVWRYSEFHCQAVNTLSITWVRP